MIQNTSEDLDKEIFTSDRQSSKMDIWERKLLDFSLRNTLLNLSLKRRAIQLRTVGVDKLEDNLSDGDEYSVMFCDDSADIRKDIEQHKLHTYLTEAETRNALKNIYRASRNSIEETGANSLFLAIGTIKWYETKTSEHARYAPIMLLPMEMVYKRGAYYIRTRDDEMILNITLTEYLRQNFDITIEGLNPLPKDEHGIDVPLVLETFRGALKERERWDVEGECVLGIFSFSKFLMWNDIHSHRSELLHNNIVRSLVEQHLTWRPNVLTSSLKSKDKELRPEQLALPVPADSSQMIAVYEAGLGHSFILYGPPGTGKSQTITNVIANALFQGKRVLFVAEKMAALNVVQKRLENVGLAPFCLELHSNKTTKKHILEQLELALKVTHIVSPEDYKHTAETLYEERKKLIAYLEALHEVKDDDGFSVYECITQYEANDAELLKGEILNNNLKKYLRKEKIAELRFLLSNKLESIIKIVGQPSQHPLLGMNVTENDLVPDAGIWKNIEYNTRVITDGIKEHDDLINCASLREKLLKDNNEMLFDQNGEELYTEWRKARAKWFIPRYFAKKNFIKRLRKYNEYIIEDDIDTLIDMLIEYQKKHRSICGIQDAASKTFATEYATDEMPTLESLKTMSSKLSKWIENKNVIRDWYQWCAFRSDLIEKGLDIVVEKIESEDIVAEKVCNSYIRSLFKTLAEDKISHSNVLRTFEGMIFDETVKRYKDLTEKFQMLSQKQLYAKLASQIPHVTDNVDNSSEIGLLKRNISNGGRGMSMRDLMEQIPTLMQKLCPCMLMSPMSVSQYLTLTQDKFDLVIFDEASQMPTSEAVGAIARGKTLIVVGDPKQMPPTSFFNTTNVDDDEAELDDMESILEDCRALEVPSLQLNWHYRSQHESLIAFSNNEYYDGSLITFPSVDDQKAKVSYVKVNGFYDKGGRRTNRGEAEAITKEVVHRLNDSELRQHSIGIVAFSVAQQNLIDDILTETIESDIQLHEYAEAMYEPIFIKNLENVQGDERDVILFSIGYGPDKDGNVSMNFGPLNNNGGERRLNVAVSRARQEMMVFSTLSSEQIDLRRTKSKGVEGLKHFLEYAEQQVLTKNNVDESEDSFIAKQIAKALKDKGYIVQTGIGRSQFKVDVAIASKEDPNVYSLGILLDGNVYHNTQTTRDREIVQPSVLQSLNWQVMRVWSVDWMTNPVRVINRIIKKLEEAPQRKIAKKANKFDISNEKIIEHKTNAIEYKEYRTSESNACILTDFSITQEILKVEQPMTMMGLCRRVCALRGLSKVTPTIIRTFKDVASNYFYVEPDRDGFSVWLNQSFIDSYKTYRPNSGRDVTYIPMAEIRNVILEAIKEQFSINTTSLTLIAAKKLGFTRRGNKVTIAFDEAVKQLKAKGVIEEKDGKLKVK